MDSDFVWNDKVLQMDFDDGCTTMRPYLMSLNCTLKMVNTVNFMLFIFHHNKIHVVDRYQGLTPRES